MSNELAVAKQTTGVVDREDFVGQFQSQQQAYTSIVANTLAEKKKLFNIMNADQTPVSDMIGKTIMLKDVYMETVELVRKDTNDAPILDEDGEPTYNKAPRIVLVDDKGKGYQCVSTSILSSLKKLQLCMGPPTWAEPLKVEVKQITKGAKRLFSLELV